MTARELSALVFERLATFNVGQVMPALRKANDGALEDVLNINGSAYYQFMACLVDILKPKQVVELGGAMGVGTLMLLHFLPENSKLYSITLPEGGLEFSYIADKYPNLTIVLGDDLDLAVWPKDCDLSKTDLYFFDSLHTKEQLTKELELYTPFFKKGAVLLFDDIRMPDLWPIWESLTYNKTEVTNPCHYTGFGICIV